MSLGHSSGAVCKIGLRLLMQKSKSTGNSGCAATPRADEACVIDDRQQALLLEGRQQERRRPFSSLAGKAPEDCATSSQAQLPSQDRFSPAPLMPGHQLLGAGGGSFRMPT
jgi:hypothetical protein